MRDIIRSADIACRCHCHWLVAIGCMEMVPSARGGVRPCRTFIGSYSSRYSPRWLYFALEPCIRSIELSAIKRKGEAAFVHSGTIIIASRNGYDEQWSFTPVHSTFVGLFLSFFSGHPITWQCLKSLVIYWCLYRVWVMKIIISFTACYSVLIDTSPFRCPSALYHARFHPAQMC